VTQADTETLLPLETVVTVETQSLYRFLLCRSNQPIGDMVVKAVLAAVLAVVVAVAITVDQMQLFPVLRVKADMVVSVVKVAMDVSWFIVK
jgi:hypothetical protein